MSYPDPLDFPPELCTKPSAPVGLFGLNITNNSLHRTIWELFKVHENSLVTFKLFETSHNFPCVKAKNPRKYSYENDTGISWIALLKRNWMKKHLVEIPAVAVLFFDLNWDDSNAEDLKAQCVSELQVLRNSLAGHTTKIAIILIQKTAPLPDDAKAAEKAKQFCMSCEIEARQLFVLPQGDHLQGYVVRLGNALFELSQQYYHYKIKLIKQYKDQVNKIKNKIISQYLHVRHHFKLGFLSELKQDNLNAKKFYEIAYSYLKKMEVNCNVLEIKLVAGFINYKICYLMFLLNQPRDAINHFRSHIDYYKNKIEDKMLIFEDYSWLCKQYTAFGDIFDDAIRRGLSAVQTQHPGFYYRLAALSAMDRKNACLKLCSKVTTYPRNDPLKDMQNIKYFGERPWRVKGMYNLVFFEHEKNAICALSYNENLVNHSEIIIGLLGRAISQFKAYNCPRMRLQLVVQMADEYYYSKDYGKALTLLTHILWDYRNEKWWLILSTLISRALSCAYLSASIQDYVSFALEALGPSCIFDSENKKRIFNNLSSILKMKTPEPEPDIPQADAVSAAKLWKTYNSTPSASFSIEMSNIRSCIEAKARFTKSAFSSEETIIVEIFIRCSCLYAIEFSNISVIINSQNYSSEFAVSSEKYCLTCEPGVMKKLHCEFNCDPSDSNKNLHVRYVLLTLGSPKERSVVLKYSISNCNEGAGLEKGNVNYQYFRINSPDVEDFDQIENLGVAKIIPKDSKVKIQVQHDSPALLSEWYPIHVLINNEENFTLLNSTIEVKFSASDDATEQSTQLCSHLKNSAPASKLSFSVKDIPSSQTEDQVFYLRGHRSGVRSLSIKFWYCMNSENVKFFVEALVTVPVIKPFDVSTEILSMKFEQIDKCFFKDPFILSQTVKILSPWPILIHYSSLELGLYVKTCDNNLESHLAGSTLNEGDGGTDMFALRIDDMTDQPIALGTYILQWSRVGNPEVTSSSITMPAITCKPTIISLEMSLPAHGWVRKPMTVEYRLYNNTSTLLELDLVMLASDAFIFAGQKQVLLRLLPNSVRKLEYNLHPLFSGLVALPRMILRSSSDEYSEQLSHIIERNLPTHVYVMPQEKTNPVAVGS